MSTQLPVDLTDTRFEIGRVFEIRGYGYPMIVTGIDRGNRKLLYITLMPAVQVGISWKTFGAMDVTFPEDIAEANIVSRVF